MKIAIIGGGAAGFMAALTAKETHAHDEVYVLERAPKVLAKVAITGGGRCNVTNSFRLITDLKQAYPRGHRLMKRLMAQFDHVAAYRWFEERGVRLVTQADECVFPVSQDAMSVVGCLVGEAQRHGVQVLTGCSVEAVVPRDGRFELYLAGRDAMLFDRVAVTTGGLPHRPGFLRLEDVGVRFEPPIPSLFTFNVADKALTSLMGTVVEGAVVTIPSTKFKAEGPLLITHWGMSGPAVLRLSSHAARHLHEQAYRVPLAVSWVGAVNAQMVVGELGRLSALNAQKLVANVSPLGLPSRLWTYLLARLAVPAERRWAELGLKTINRMAEMLTNDLYAISGKGTFRDEFVTCGGVALSQVDAHTLEHKQLPGLFFAGEVLDIDAITGGYNLQAAWTTGVVVGRNIGR